MWLTLHLKHFALFLGFLVMSKATAVRLLLPLIKRMSPTKWATSKRYEKNILPFFAKNNIESFNDWSIDEWHHHFSNSNGIGKSCYQEDLAERAQTFIKNAIDESKKAFVYLDGHGRFTWHLIDQLKKLDEDPNDYVFHVVDNNFYTNIWHQRVLPNKNGNFHFHNSNVFNYLKKQQKWLENNTIVYLNFCGIGWKNGISQETNIIKSIEEYNCLRMVSYSGARKAKNKYQQLDKIRTSDTYWRRNVHRIGKSKRRGGDFHTFILSRFSQQ